MTVKSVMNCKHCGEEIKKLGDFWIHISKYTKYYHCCVVINNISSNLRATPIEKYETNNDFIKALEAL